MQGCVSEELANFKKLRYVLDTSIKRQDFSYIIKILKCPFNVYLGFIGSFLKDKDVFSVQFCLHAWIFFWQTNYTIQSGFVIFSVLLLLKQALFLNCIRYWVVHISTLFLSAVLVLETIKGSLIDIWLLIQNCVWAGRWQNQRLVGLSGHHVVQLPFRLHIIVSRQVLNISRERDSTACMTALSFS